MFPWRPWYGRTSSSGKPQKVCWIDLTVLLWNVSIVASVVLPPATAPVVARFVTHNTHTHTHTRARASTHTHTRTHTDTCGSSLGACLICSACVHARAGTRCAQSSSGRRPSLTQTSPPRCYSSSTCSLPTPKHSSTTSVTPPSTVRCGSLALLTTSGILSTRHIRERILPLSSSPTTSRRTSHHSAAFLHTQPGVCWESLADKNNGCERENSQRRGVAAAVCADASQCGPCGDPTPAAAECLIRVRPSTCSRPFSPDVFEASDENTLNMPGQTCRKDWTSRSAWT